MFEDNIEYANHKLSDSIVRLRDGKHVLITGVMGVNDVECVYNKDFSNISLEDIDPEIPLLGYISYQGKTIYGQRNPTRAWKFGISRNNSTFRPDRDEPFNPDLIRVAKYLNDPYPNFYDCIDTLKRRKTNSRIAFHRHFSLGGDKTIFYKSKHVANIEGSNFILLPRFEYLREFMVEVVEGKR